MKKKQLVEGEADRKRLSQTLESCCQSEQTRLSEVALQSDLPIPLGAAIWAISVIWVSEMHTQSFYDWFVSLLASLPQSQLTVGATYKPS